MPDGIDKMLGRYAESVQINAEGVWAAGIAFDGSDECAGP